MNQQQVVSPPQLISQDQIARRFMTKLAWLMAGGMFIDGFVLGYLGALMPSITTSKAIFEHNVVMIFKF